MDQDARRAARAAFDAYAARYDVSDERIALKVEHTYEVAGIREQVALGGGLSARDVGLAWLCGLLHDISRFEQIRRWDTFLRRRIVQPCRARTGRAANRVRPLHG